LPAAAPPAPATGTSRNEPAPKAATSAPQPKAPVAPVAVEPQLDPKPAEKPKPPTKLRARMIDTWVVRQPLPEGAQESGPKPAPSSTPDRAPATEKTAGGVKYQLEKARCDGMVSVHQDPVDATKPQGTDIIGSLMIIEGSPDGNIMTVFGWDNRPGEVHNEGTHLIGPKVVVDQLHNIATVEGRGSLAMPTSTDLSGATLKNAEVVVINFKDGMNFEGALKRADFFGKVNAVQGGSWVTCNTLRVNFDRPVYLTQANRPGAAKPAAQQPKDPKAAPDDKAKIERVDCYPAPADAADHPRDLEVWFTQVDLDPVTSKVTRIQKLRAFELTLKAQVQDPGGSEPYREVIADGPGVVRTWEPGAKDEAGQGAAAPKQPGNGQRSMKGNNEPAEMEMKLTQVNFSSRMIARDKGKPYQSATFFDRV
ncbi:MAG TPA: hypothetical protein VLM40_13635, partial [Gemmata sp.]|nr:hypothetical protein [Gemmata sp.]